MKPADEILHEIKSSLKNAGVHYEDYEVPVYADGYYPGAKPCGTEMTNPEFSVVINGKYLKSIGRKGHPCFTKDWRFANTWALTDSIVEFLTKFLSRYDDGSYEFVPDYGHLLIQNHVQSLKWSRGLTDTRFIAEDKVNGYSYHDHMDEAYDKCPYKYYDELPAILALPVIR